MCLWRDFYRRQRTQRVLVWQLDVAIDRGRLSLAECLNIVLGLVSPEGGELVLVAQAEHGGAVELLRGVAELLRHVCDLSLEVFDTVTKLFHIFLGCIPGGAVRDALDSAVEGIHSDGVVDRHSLRAVDHRARRHAHRRGERRAGHGRVDPHVVWSPRCFALAADDTIPCHPVDSDVDLALVEGQDPETEASRHHGHEA